MAVETFADVELWLLRATVFVIFMITLVRFVRYELRKFKTDDYI